MCCFVLVLGLLGPRFAFLYTWIFTDRVSIAFSGGWILPLLGLLFLPWTALVFVLAYAPVVGVSPLGWFLVFLGFLADIATYSSRSAQQRYSGGQTAVV
jgi:hypothetical protein